MRKAVTPKTMELIKSSDLYFGRKGLWARWRARAIMKLAALDRINRLYSDALAYEGPFPEGLLHAMDVRTEVDPREADRIPPEGPAIVIANHPTGALDGIVLIDWLSKRRPDARFMGNYLLSRIGPLKRYFISVDPFDAKAAGNVSGMREAMRHLSRGGLLVIFPAGEVATWRKGFRDIGDREWPRGVMRFIRRAEVPVIPLYIDARNSPLFRLAGKLHPMLRTALLPRELLNKKGVGVELRIGSAVLPRKTASLTETDYNGYLRASVEYFKPLDGRRRPPPAAPPAAPTGTQQRKSGRGWARHPSAVGARPGGPLGRCPTRWWAPWNCRSTTPSWTRCAAVTGFSSMEVTRSTWLLPIEFRI